MGPRKIKNISPWSYPDAAAAGAAAAAASAAASAVCIYHVLIGGALRAPLWVHGEIHTAEAAAEAAAAAPAAAASLHQVFQVDTKGLSLSSILL